MQKTHYEILGITPEQLQGLTDDQIEAIVNSSFRKRVKQIHPDISSNTPNETTGLEMAELVAAKDTLSDPELRAQYDSSISDPLIIVRPQTTSARPAQSGSTPGSQPDRQSKSNIQLLLDHIRKTAGKPYLASDFQKNHRFTPQELIEIIEQSKNKIFEEDIYNWILNQYLKLDSKVLDAIVKPDTRGYASRFDFRDLFRQHNLTSEHLAAYVKGSMVDSRRKRVYEDIFFYGEKVKNKDNPNQLIDGNLIDAMIAPLTGSHTDVQLVDVLLKFNSLQPSHTIKIIEATKNGHAGSSITQKIIDVKDNLNSDEIDAIIETLDGSQKNLMTVNKLVSKYNLSKEQNDAIRQNVAGGRAELSIVAILPPLPEPSFLDRFLRR